MNKYLLVRAATFLWMAVIFLSAHADSAKRVSMASITGQVIDVVTGEPVVNAVINASWVLQEQDGHGDRRLLVLQVKTDQQGKYYFPEQKARRFIPKNWELRPGYDPVLSVFADGYKQAIVTNTQGSDKKPYNAANVKIRKFVGDGQILNVEPYQLFTRGQIYDPQWLDELAVWRHAIISEIDAYKWRNLELAKQSQVLLKQLLSANCRRIPKEERNRVCFGTDYPKVDAGQTTAETDYTTDSEKEKSTVWGASMSTHNMKRK